MLSYGSVDLIQPSGELASWIETQIPVNEAFAFPRPQRLGSFDPRTHFNWFLSRKFRVNAFVNPWGASRWGMAFVLADDRMLEAIRAQAYANNIYTPLPFIMSDGLGNGIETDLWMLPPVPLTAIKTLPSLGVALLPLVDDRYFWWNQASVIEVQEGVTTWSQLFGLIATDLGISLSVDAISSSYLFPSSGLSVSYEYLPMLLDAVASSVGMRIVRTLEGEYYARSPISARALTVTQALAYPKIAGGSLALGVIDA